MCVPTLLQMFAGFAIRCVFACVKHLSTCLCAYIHVYVYMCIYILFLHTYTYVYVIYIYIHTSMHRISKVNHRRKSSWIVVDIRVQLELYTLYTYPHHSEKWYIKDMSYSWVIRHDNNVYFVVDIRVQLEDMHTYVYTIYICSAMHNALPCARRISLAHCRFLRTNNITYFYIDSIIHTYICINMYMYVYICMYIHGYA